VSVQLVTGGAGFIGSHLVHALARDGHHVRVLDDLSQGSAANLGPPSTRVEFVRGDVRDLECVRRACQGVEVVFHHAALASVSRSVDDPRTTHDVCVTGTVNVLWAAKEAGVRRVVYAASSSAYGGADPPSHEGQLPATMSPYAAAKLAGEYYCASFTHVFGLETVRLRYFNIFGPRQDPASPYSAVIPLFISAMLKGQSPMIFGDGRQSRDFTYIDNVVHANLRAASATGVSGNVYNVGTGVAASLLDLIDHLNAILGTKMAPTHGPDRPGDVRLSKADLTRASAELGYRPQVSLEEGLCRTVAYYRATLS
jgi:UDP-glucose 4-epimerase